MGKHVAIKQEPWDEAAAPPLALSAERLAKQPQTAKLVLRLGARALVLRKPSGLWDFPGGRLEPGETVMQALAREILEETQLTLPPVRLAGQWLRPRTGRTPLFIHFFLADVDQETIDSVRLSAEHDARQLADAHDAARLPLAEGYRRILLDVLPPTA